MIGGLDRYLRRWAGDAKAPIAEEVRRRFLNLLAPNYASLGKDEREEWVSNMLRLLAQAEHKGPARARVRSKAQAPGAHSLDSPITSIRGISSSLALKFGRLGVSTVRDLLYFFPRRHLDYSQIKPISELKEWAEQTIVATVWEAQEATFGGRRGTEAIVGDETGNIRVVWFNQPYLARRLRTNAKVVISGRVSIFKGRKVFESPEWEPLSQELTHTGRLVPIYPLTEGLSPRVVRKLVKETVDEWAPKVPDFLPEDVRSRAKLLELPEAITQFHYPDSNLLRDMARRRLAFDELFLIQLGVLSRKRNWQEGVPGTPIRADRQILDTFLNSLPFTLTSAQRRALNEILADLEKEKPMSRLLQGEVGSGKTVVATAALLVAVASGCQAVLMAPTEILAEQHFGNICQLLARAKVKEYAEGHLRVYSALLPCPFTVALLTGSLGRGEKQGLHRRIGDGEVDIVVGTHALIQKGVEFKRLGLAIVDEQHRFGVMQRSALRQKGASPHLLVMTATPIPRSLALTLYGDLDLSIIDELPPGRQVIRTRWLHPEQREDAYSFLRTQVAEGHQAFIICPLIEESEKIEAKAATREYERLSMEVFPDLRLGLLHGRMSAREKEMVMRQFRKGELDILVATPVVEVGIDVPNATVMLVEGADRFGFSQLHQFRGRVGRGEHQSYCLLLAGNPSPEARDRLSLFEQTQDGFVLAEEDLRLRGPGEFFGTRQSGLPDLKMARLSDVGLLELARSEAIRLFERDPRLERAEHRLLTEEVARLFRDGVSVGEA